MRPTAEPGNDARTKVRLIAALSVAIPTTLISVAPLTEVSALTAALALIAALFWLALGAMLYLDPSRRRLGVTILVLGFLWPLQFLSMLRIGPVEVVGTVGTMAFWVVGARLGFTFMPDHALTRAERRFIVIYSLYTSVTLAGGILFGRPEWLGFRSDAWWPTAFESRQLFDLFTGVWPIADPITTVSFVTLMILRIRRMPALDRGDMTPILVTFCIMAAYSSARSLEVQQNWYSPQASELMPLAVCGGLTALALAGTELRRRMRDQQMNLVLQQQLRSSELSFKEIEGVLRSVLRDPSVNLLASDTTEKQGSQGKHQLTEVRSSNGELLAVIEGAGYLARHRRTLSAVADACGASLESLRLRDIVAEGRLVASDAVARAEQSAADLRRLEQDLHDDLQQRLLALRLRIGMVGKRPSAELEESLESLSRDIGVALEAVRELVRGESPPELRELGLQHALELRAASAPFDVSLRMPRGVPSSVEQTIYFVVCEALNNATKHAAATHVKVDINVDSGQIRVSVLDNGVGVSGSALGFGLSGIRRRVEQMGGAMELSRLEVGTELKAVMPCA